MSSLEGGESLPLLGTDLTAKSSFVGSYGVNEGRGTRVTLFWNRQSIRAGVAEGRKKNLNRYELRQPFLALSEWMDISFWFLVLSGIHCVCLDWRTH
ncbi:hypothetical protein TNIN_333921 [Trichonephila inaurata madagascariensis]|uniref:Uncharacterized protein n=1 Tax=Trichonephila inaurata madagascariensis TaxID=2747483 RepID=A0A8X6YHK8_9ARAC|nr:hypothetical protein TNIN_333921 [Trichonephila inaurata madagascariensis]